MRSKPTKAFTALAAWWRAALRSEHDPLVEFYDAKWAGVKFGPRGQFVSRYYASTLLESGCPMGLQLDGAIPEWKVSPESMQEVIAYIKEQA